MKNMEEIISEIIKIYYDNKYTTYESQNTSNYN